MTDTSLWDRTLHVIQENGVSPDDIFRVEFSLLANMSGAEKHQMLMTETGGSPAKWFQIYSENLRACTRQEFEELCRTLPLDSKLHTDVKILGNGWTMTVDNRCNWKFNRMAAPAAPGTVCAHHVVR